jgi:hypothetical protein
VETTNTESSVDEEEGATFDALQLKLPIPHPDQAQDRRSGNVPYPDQQDRSSSGDDEQAKS